MEVSDEAAAARYRSDAAAAPPGREVVPVHDNIEEGEEQIDEPVSEGHQGNHDFSGQLSLLYPPSAIQQYFPCKTCGKVFTTPGSLRNHNKIHTGDTSCSICHRQLATVSSL